MARATRYLPRKDIPTGTVKKETAVLLNTVFSGVIRLRKRFAPLFLVLAGVALSACQTVSSQGTGQRVDRAKPLRVAMLLPYGSEKGGDTVVARALEDAARLAIADLSGVAIDLKVYSTAGSPAQGAAVAQQAADEGAQVILGPLYAEVAAAAGVAVADDNVAVLSFSNNIAVAGGGVYLLGNTFQNTAQRVLNYAASQGNTSLILMYGNDTAGSVARDAVRSAAARSGASISGEVTYELSQNGVVSAVPQVRDLVRRNNANGLFLTSSTSGALPLFAQLLPEAGLNPAEVQFMGLARWDIPAEALAIPGLQGGIFALPDPILATRFSERFQAAYGRGPHPLSGLAYDGIAAIGAIIKDGAAQIGAQQLTNPSGFAGVNGVFRLRADGTNERALAVAKIVNSQLQVVSPAPNRFGNAGF